MRNICKKYKNKKIIALDQTVVEQLGQVQSGDSNNPVRSKNFQSKFFIQSNFSV